MKLRSICRGHLAIGRKTPQTRGRWGQGFNLLVEVEWTSVDVGHDERLREALGRIDHRSLGVDLDLGFPAEGAALAAWLARELGAGVARVTLLQGDGRGFSWRSSN